MIKLDTADGHSFRCPGFFDGQTILCHESIVVI
jgi:hypothetical protein